MSEKKEELLLHGHNHDREVKVTRTALNLALLFVVAVAFFWLSVGVANSESSDQMKQSTEVRIDNFSFGPATLTIPAGTTVTWTNHDDIPHNVVSTDGVFKSKVIDTDESFSFTFTKAGTYPYFCAIHPKMTGKVIVK